MEEYCYKCHLSIKKNDEYLHCFKCDSKYCTTCIEKNKFYFDKSSLLFKYNCKHCIKTCLL